MMLSKRRAESWSHAAKRISKARVVCAVVVASGAVLISYTLVSLVASYSQGVSPLFVQNVGYIEYIVPPVGARRLSEVKSFRVRMGYADDYGRVYVNNYVVANRFGNEGNKSIFYAGKQNNEKEAGEINQLMRDRNDNSDGTAVFLKYLRPGENFVVVEVENWTGACWTEISIEINGITFQGFPRIMPYNDVVEFKGDHEVKRDSEVVYPKIGRDVRSANALCTRRIFQFDLL